MLVSSMMRRQVRRGGRVDTTTIKTSGLLLLLAFAAGFAGLALAMALNWIAGASYAPWTNYISDLSIGAGGASIVFIVQMALIALFSLVFFLYSAAGLKRMYGSPGAVNVARVFGVITSLTVIVMVFFPLDPDRPASYTAHVWTGTVIFVCVAVLMIAYTVVFSRQRGILRLANIAAIICAVASLVFAPLFALTELADLIPRHLGTYLVEWIAFPMLAVWMLLVGIGLRRAS
jgi:hypothetical protein